MKGSFDGRIFITGTPAIAGNTAYNIVPPSSELRWELLGLYMQITCDASVANRTVNIFEARVSDNAPIGIYLSTNPAITAGQTKIWNISKLASITNFTVPTDFAAFIPGPGIILTPVNALRITVTNGVAGDVVSGRFVVREFAS